MMKVKEMPVGKLSRSRVVGATAANVGLKKLRFFAEQTLSSKSTKSRLKQVHDEEIARIIFSALSLLRGTALKAAQLLSMEVDLLPNSLRKELAKSCYQVPPINRALVRKVISSELGLPPEKLFNSFQSKPFAAASLGQVHEGITRKGNKVAIKIQYPGIGDTIESDLGIVTNLLRMAPYSNVTLPMMEEIKTRLVEELNYELEAERMKWFADRIKPDFIKIPKLEESYCTKHVLTATKLKGLHLNEWLDSDPPQKEKNHFAQLLLEFTAFGLYQLGAIHADPNPGNFLFRNDGTIGLVDFGCIKQFDNDFIKNIKMVFSSFQNLDVEQYKKALTLLDYKIEVKPKKKQSLQKDPLFAWATWFSKCLQIGSFSFKENPHYLREGYEIVKTVGFGNTNVIKINKDFVFLERTLLGLFRIFEKLQATVDFGVLSGSAPFTLIKPID